MDTTGRPVVALTTLNSRAAAATYLRDLRAALGDAPAEPAVQLVRYDFDQLVKWNDALIPRLGQDIIFLDVDETQNAVIVGVPPSVSINAIASGLLAVMPADAFVVQHVGPFLPDLTLNQTIRPTKAGISIGPDGCSLGFNTQYGGARAFVTASHCSQTQYGSDSGPMYQPLFGGKIGYEILDKAPGTGYTQIPWTGQTVLCRSPGCRYSDAQITLYYDSVASLQGEIARTTYYGITGPGSVTIDPTKYFTITNKLTFSWLTVGRWLSKIGAYTGWTWGQITHTCVSVSLPAVRLLCQFQTDYYRHGGDSGGPVFLDGDMQNPPPSINAVHMVGIHVAGSTTNPRIGFFSSVESIEYDLGVSLKVCNWSNSC